MPSFHVGFVSTKSIYMYKNSSQSANLDIEQLLEENFKLRRLLNENHIEFESTTNTSLFFENNPFEQSLSLSKSELLERRENLNLNLKK